MQDYYNTNREAGETLAASRGRASYQRDQVLAFFQANPGRMIAPHEVHQAIADEGTPLTSIRRAITDLTELGYLEKTLEMRIGTYGKQVHTWRLKQKPAEQLSLWRN